MPNPPRRKNRDVGRDPNAAAPAAAPAAPAAAPPAPDWLSAAASSRVAAGAIAIVGVVLLALQLTAHRVGDYDTETDFYGGYAPGALALEAGHFDARRYTVVGPVYEATLALVGFVTRDLFLAARLLSTAAACGTLALWFALLRRRAGPAAAVGAVLLLGANPLFLRYGLAVTTDGLALALQGAALFALLAMRGARAPFWAGLLAALATLTRYSGVYLLPGGIAALWMERKGGRAIGWFLAGFALLAVPWLLAAARPGALPGSALYHNLAFDIYARPQGIAWDEYQARLGPQFHSFGDVLTRDPQRVIAREIANVADHARLDASDLLGWPVAALCLAGLGIALRSGPRGRGLGALGGLFALQFVALVPAFYSARYSLALAPFYLAAAGAAFAWSRPGAVGRWRAPLGPALAAAPLAFSLVTSVATLGRALRDLPVELLPAGRALRAAASPGARLMARKPHLASIAGLAAVPFPSAYDLSDLAGHCRRERADFVLFSEPEARSRPQFWFLLDTATAVPGLEPVYFEERPPVAVYRVRPGLGETPAWLIDDSLRARTFARARVLGDPIGLECRARVTLAIGALDRRDLETALRHAVVAARTCPGDPMGWRIAGDACLGLGRPDSARSAYRVALERDPQFVPARIGLGSAELMAGRFSEAAEAWRPVVAVTEDPATLEAMAALFERVGDAQAAGVARAMLARLRP
jgi:hypothetical protein